MRTFNYFYRVHDITLCSSTLLYNQFWSMTRTLQQYPAAWMDTQGYADSRQYPKWHCTGTCSSIIALASHVQGSHSCVTILLSVQSSWDDLSILVLLFPIMLSHLAGLCHWLMCIYCFRYRFLSLTIYLHTTLHKLLTACLDSQLDSSVQTQKTVLTKVPITFLREVQVY